MAYQIAHPKPGEPYHRYNDPKGVKRAVRNGFDGIDLDDQMTKACPKRGEKNWRKGCRRDDCKGHAVNTHWGQPLLRDGFIDPLRPRRDKHVHVRQCYVWEVLRWLAVDRTGVYRITRIERNVCLALSYGIDPWVEPKADKRFEQDWPWAHLMGIVRARFPNAKVFGYAIRNLPTARAGSRRAAAMRRAGIHAHTIR